VKDLIRTFPLFSEVEGEWWQFCREGHQRRLAQSGEQAHRCSLGNLAAHATAGWYALSLLEEVELSFLEVEDNMLQVTECLGEVRYSESPDSVSVKVVLKKAKNDGEKLERHLEKLTVAKLPGGIPVVSLLTREAGTPEAVTERMSATLQKLEDCRLRLPRDLGVSREKRIAKGVDWVEEISELWLPVNRFCNSVQRLARDIRGELLEEYRSVLQRRAWNGQRPSSASDVEDAISACIRRMIQRSRLAGKSDRTELPLAEGQAANRPQVVPIQRT